MKIKLSHSSHKKIDYFDILSEQEPKPKPEMYKTTELTFEHQTRKKTKKFVKKVVKPPETEADRLRKKEIRAAKIEIYYLRTNRRPNADYKADETMQSRREELINSKLALSEYYR